jgi:ribosomal protein S12 methylthiotransferase accessory factor
MEMTITFPGGARVDAAFGPHTLHTDQPPKTGGDDTAPTPFATFLASIATCAGVYVLAFCRQRELSTDGIRLTQTLDVDHATGLVRDIRIDIHVPPTFPAKYYDALVRAAEQCTVKKHLEHPPQIVVRTVADAALAH